MAWLRSGKGSEISSDYRYRVDQIRRDVVSIRSDQIITRGADVQHALRSLARKLNNCLLSRPTKSLQQAAREDDNRRLAILGEARELIKERRKSSRICQVSQMTGSARKLGV